MKADNLNNMIIRDMINKNGGNMHTVKVYSTPTCPYCLRAKDYLKQKNVAFQNIDVSTDKSGLDEMVKVSGQMGVPVIVVDQEVIVGFDRDRLEELLK